MQRLPTFFLSPILSFSPSTSLQDARCYRSPIHQPKFQMRSERQRPHFPARSALLIQSHTNLPPKLCGGRPLTTEKLGNTFFVIAKRKTLLIRKRERMGTEKPLTQPGTAPNLHSWTCLLPLNLQILYLQKLSTFYSLSVCNRMALPYQSTSMVSLCKGILFSYSKQ